MLKNSIYKFDEIGRVAQSVEQRTENPLILSVTQIKTIIVSARFTEFRNSYFIIELSHFIIPYRTSKSPQ